MQASTERQLDPLSNDDSAQEAAIRPLLARANLLRIRGQWEEAIAVCTEALRLAPRSASAHSLLGDIYAGLGRIDDAAQWFAMAVDLAPTNTTDRAKLQRTMEAQRLRYVSEEPRVPVAVLSPLPLASGKPAAEKTLEWFDRVFPPGRSDSIARLIFVMCGGIAFLLLLSAGFVYLTLRRDADSVPAEATGYPSSSSLTGSAAFTPVVMTPTVHAPSAPKALVAPVAVVVATPAPVVRLAASTNGSDSVFRSRLVALLPAGITLVSASGGETTAQGGIFSLTVAVPAAAENGVPDTTLRERVVRAAASASWAVFSLLPRSTVHIVVLIQNRRLSTPVAFTAEAYAATFHDIEPATASLLDLLSRFRSIQWGAELLPASNKTEATPIPNAVPSTLAGNTAE